MALSLCVFSFAAFAGEENNVKISKNGFEIKGNVAKTIDKLVIENNATNLTVVAVEGGYTLIKITIKANCPGDYSTMMVLTIKIWDDENKDIEFYPWYQESHLICS